MLAVIGQVAQLVEQRTENPCVGGSIPPLATIFRARSFWVEFQAVIIPVPRPVPEGLMLCWAFVFNSK
jgi:hypothetical protein